MCKETFLLKIINDLPKIVSPKQNSYTTRKESITVLKILLRIYLLIFTGAL